MKGTVSQPRMEDGMTEKSRHQRMMTGAQIVIESLEKLGAEVVFGLPGGAIMPTYDPLMDS
ncbi:MAG: thiamine pyrophosphate-binding protein, partial [Cutibacterium avidum]|nr:thiamine pyrophosphate-binding protein [Cutibacterium avidum]